MGRQDGGDHVTICLPQGDTNSSQNSVPANPPTLVSSWYIENDISGKKRWDFNKITVVKYLLASVVLVTCTRLLLSISNVWYGQI